MTRKASPAIPALVCVVLATSAPATGAEPPQETRSQVFEAAWQTVSQGYFDPHFSGTDWEAVGERYRERLVVDVRTETDLLGLLREMLAEIPVSHLEVLMPEGSFEVGPALEVLDLPEGEVVAAVAEASSARAAGIAPGELLLTSRAERRGEPGSEVVARLEDAERVDPSSLPALDDDFSVHHLHRLLGEAGGVALYTRDLGERRYRGAVTVLIDEETGSAGEAFAMVMKTLPGVRLVGRPTAGALVSSTRFPLPNGWSLRVPTAVPFDPAGRIFFDEPVVPHREVAWTRADLCSGRDPDLAAALRAS